MDIDGVYIVAKQQGADVDLLNFKQLIHGRDKSDTPQTIRLTGVLKRNLTGDDGKVVDLQPGALVIVTRLRELVKGLAFRLQNVGTNNDSAKFQYEYALAMIGLREKTGLVISSAELNAEGEFTTVIH